MRVAREAMQAEGQCATTTTIAVALVPLFAMHTTITSHSARIRAPVG